MCVIPSGFISLILIVMCPSSHSKIRPLILAGLLGLALSTLTACGQRGPLKLPEPATPAPQKSPAR